jgi:hypothetical protein
MCSTAMVMHEAHVEPDRDVEVLDLASAIVPKKLIANTTQMSVMAMSIGQISSAYSWVWVKPSGSVSAAETMMSLPAPEVDLREACR